MLRELAELQEAYAPLPLLLSCFEDVTRPGNWCHRIWLGQWLTEHIGETIEELG